MNKARVAKKVHDMHHVPNNTKPDTMTHTESEYHGDNTCAAKNMKPLSYNGHE